MPSPLHFEAFRDRYRHKPLQGLGAVLKAAGSQDVRVALKAAGGKPLVALYDACAIDPSDANLARLETSMLGHSRHTLHQLARLQARHEDGLWAGGAPASLTGAQSNLESSDLQRQRSAELSRGAATPSLYGAPNLAPHGFSNETGLNACVAKLQVRGGSTVGVLGEALEVGSAIESEWVLSVDADPRAEEFLQTLNVMLLSVGSLAEQQGWDSEHAAYALQQRIAGDVPVAITAHEVHAAGLCRDLPSEVLEEKLWQVRTSFRESVNDFAGAPINWLNCPEAPHRVQHLMQLARAGRLLAVTAECGDPHTMSLVSSFLERNAAPVSAICLSNIFDYTALVSEVAQAFRQLPLRPDAVLISTAHVPGWDLRTGKGAALLADLGDWWNPGVQSAEAWLKADGGGEALDNAIWANPENRVSCWQTCLHQLPTENDWVSLDEGVRIGRTLGASEETLQAWRAAAPAESYLFAKHLLLLGVPTSSRECREWMTRLKAALSPTVL